MNEHELEKDLGIKNQLHRKKLRYSHTVLMSNTQVRNAKI